jgi:hypothetical protein
MSSNSAVKRTRLDRTSTGGTMPKRIIFVPAMLAILVIVLTSRSGGAEPAGDDCIVKPNSAPPQGSHWYYRVDRTANRRCWYLGPKGLKVRQAESPKRLPSVTPNAQPTMQPTIEMRAEATASLNGLAANASTSFPALSKSAASSDREPASLKDNAGEHTTTDDLSLQFGAAAERPAEAAAAEQPPELAVAERAAVSAAAEEAPFSARPGQILATAAGVLVLVAVLLLTIYRLFGIQRLRRRRKLRDQRRVVANAARPRKVLSPTLASKITGRRQAEVVRQSLSIPRCLNAAREPLNRANANDDLEMDLRRLLYHSQRRAA